VRTVETNSCFRRRGLVRGEVFPGLRLDPAALLQRDTAAVLKRVQEGLGGPEPVEFVSRLERAREQSGKS